VSTTTDKSLEETLLAEQAVDKIWTNVDEVVGDNEYEVPMDLEKEHDILTRCESMSQEQLDYNDEEANEIEQDRPELKTNKDLKAEVQRLHEKLQSTYKHHKNILQQHRQIYARAKNTITQLKAQGVGKSAQMVSIP